MKRSTRIISILLALLMIIGTSCIAVYAAENAGDYGGDYSGNDNNAGEGGQADAGNAGGSGQADQGNADGGGQADQDNSGYNDAGGSDYGSGDSGYDPYNAGYVDNGSGDDQGSWNSGGSNNGSGNSNEPGSAGSVGDKTTLYDTDDVNDKDFEANQWSDIELDESKAEAAGTSDFTQMQTDTGTEDDSQWMLYLGIGLIGLSFLGILYFILATMQAKKRNNRRAAAERQRIENSRSGGYSRQRPVEAPSKAKQGHYANENAAPRRKSSPRSDTDEIYLPKRVK